MTNEKQLELAKEWYNNITTTKKEKILLEELFPELKSEGLTEFEKKLADLLVYNHPMDIESAESISKRKSKQLLELARKEAPQNWKPSKEQMEALFEAKLASTKNREYFLGLLYEDLKKL